MLKTQMVREYCSRINVNDLFAIKFMLLTFKSFLALIRHSAKSFLNVGHLSISFL